MPVDLDLDAELTLLGETARRFASTELQPQARAAERAAEVEPSVVRAAEQIGLGALGLPESLGGSGLGCLARCVVNEELGAADAGGALACDPWGPAVYALCCVDVPVAEELLAPLRAEDGARCVWIDAGDGRFESRADALEAAVAWVPSSRVDLAVVDDGERMLFVRDGIQISSVRGAGLRSAGACEVRIATAPIAACVSAEDAVRTARAGARLYVASLLLGVMRQACEYSRDYAVEREAFGKPIAHHQALAFLIADMYAAVEGVGALVREAAWRLDAGDGGVVEAAQAWIEAIEVSRFVGPNAVQILGGHGFMQDHPVEKYMRDGRALGLLLGGIDAARRDAGAAICEDATVLDPLAGVGR